MTAKRKSPLTLSEVAELAAKRRKEGRPKGGLKIGYARVSTAEQNPDLQIHALKGYGVDEDMIYVDYASGGTLQRPELLRALRLAQRPGTEFIVWKLDRLARTVEGIMHLLAIFERRGVKFFSLTERVDLTTPMGKAIMQIMGVVAELERNLIIERTQAGLARARERGAKSGRPVAMTPGRVEVADMMLRGGARGAEVWQAVKALPGPKVSRAAYYAWQKLWDAGEVTEVDDAEPEKDEGDDG